MASETKKILERNHKAAVLKYVDGEWSDTTEGDGCIQQLYLSSQTRKQFGLLERPNLTPGIPETAFKINVVGKAGSGKTKVIALLSEQISHHIPTHTTHTETLGIHVKDIYWPAKVYGKICLFRLTFWESGESCSKRFNYISTACFDKADAVAIVINRADKSSYEYAVNELIKLDSMNLVNTSVIILVIDTDLEIQVLDNDLVQLARRKRLPFFHLPPHTLNIKYLAPFYNSLCDFLYAFKQKNAAVHV